MRMPLKKLLDHLGVGYELLAYETCPWSVYDEEKAITCSAEVRMGPDEDEMEMEIQMMYDLPKEGALPVEQVFWAFSKPVTENKWEITSMRIKGEEQAGSIQGWDEKGCNFFHACVQELKMNKLPDIDELLNREMKSGGHSGGGGQGGGGSKAPKIKPQALMGMKGGRGF